MYFNDVNLVSFGFDVFLALLPIVTFFLGRRVGYIAGLKKSLPTLESARAMMSTMAKQAAIIDLFMTGGREFVRHYVKLLEAIENENYGEARDIAAILTASVLEETLDV